MAAKKKTVKASTKPDMARMVRFAYEIGAARSRPRGWQQSLNEDMSNVAEHCYRVTFIAMMLAQMEKADPYKTAVISLVHDTDEIRALDLTPYQKPYVSIDSEKAVHDTFTGTPLASLCLPLFAEYKNKTSLEARCVKDADILDATLELVEITHRGSKYMAEIADQHAQRRAGLKTKSGQQLFDAIMSNKTTPWDWFLKGPSTFKSGTYGK
ncbi:MAG TPA: HD domain-containing protein [Alphaproteobacteria bacterium]|nr:HD domain-containing protein [Alphaproteobacteria bacterium]